MNQVLLDLIQAVKTVLRDEQKLGEALLKASPVINAMKPADRTVWFHTNIAPLVAKAYGVKAVMTRNGTTSFNDSKGKRADTALSKFRYVTQLGITGKKGGKAVSKQVDVVAKLVEQFEALTKAQQAKFLRIVQ